MGSWSVGCWAVLTGQQSLLDGKNKHLIVGAAMTSDIYGGLESFNTAIFGDFQVPGLEGAIDYFV